MASQDDEVVLMLSVMVVIATAKTLPKPRGPVVHRDEKPDWDMHASRLFLEGQFERCSRMRKRSFERLLLLLGSYLWVPDRNQSKRRTGVEPLSPAHMLQMTIRWLVGGSHHDVREVVKSSDSHFYHIVHKVMDALLCVPQLRLQFPESTEELSSAAMAFERISSQGIIKGYERLDTDHEELSLYEPSTEVIVDNRASDDHCRDNMLRTELRNHIQNQGLRRPLN
ncbi:hypothetical protein L917_10090 [Phytophthora nicotianae]|uniref:Uncharacterized protein n=2 Tax=Phytophthora nicotianae TaxID=4792 RepID=W2L3Y5_PHYNI|nr:hypothetical protein L917_10090 [Phytophthora nicotianae]